MSEGLYRAPLARAFRACIPVRSTAFGKTRIVFALGSMACLAFLFVRSGSRDVPGLTWALLVVFMVALAWWTLVLCVNATNVVVHDEYVCTTYGPVPWFRRRNGPHLVRSLSRLRVELRISTPRWLGWAALTLVFIRGAVLLLAMPLAFRHIREPVWCIVANGEHGERVVVADWIGTKAQASRLLDDLQRASSIS